MLHHLLTSSLNVSRDLHTNTERIEFVAKREQRFEKERWRPDRKRGAIEEKIKRQTGAL